jgi:hypothetical protein
MKVSRREKIKRPPTVNMANPAVDVITSLQPETAHPKKFSFSNFTSKASVGSLQGDYIALDPKQNQAVSLLDMERDNKKKRKREVGEPPTSAFDKTFPAQIKVTPGDKLRGVKSVQRPKLNQSAASSSLSTLKSIFLNKN